VRRLDVIVVSCVEVPEWLTECFGRDDVANVKRRTWRSACDSAPERRHAGYSGAIVLLFRIDEPWYRSNQLRACTLYNLSCSQTLDASR